MVYGVLKDPVLLDKLEADLLSEYGVDLYSFFRGEMSFRRLYSLVLNLPEDSRISKWIRNDPLDTNTHLLMSVVDGVNLNNYQTYYVASSDIGKDYKKIFKSAPKPQKRPKFIEDAAVEEKPRFLTGRELKGVLAERKVVIDHTAFCVESRINEGATTPEDIKCNCKSVGLNERSEKKRKLQEQPPGGG